MDSKDLINNHGMLLSVQVKQKRTYRTGTGIMIDVLNVIKDYGMTGVKISEISRKTNLSYNVTFEKCQKMIEVGLVRTTLYGRNHLLHDYRERNHILPANRGISLHHPVTRNENLE